MAIASSTALQRAAQMREAGYGRIVINVIATKAAQDLLDGCMRQNSSDFADGIRVVEPEMHISDAAHCGAHPDESNARPTPQPPP